MGWSNDCLVWVPLARKILFRSFFQDGDSIPDPFTTVPCEYHTIPEGVPVKLYAGSLSCKHGLRWADADKKETARQVYEDNLGFPLKTLAQYTGVTQKTARGWVADLLNQFEETKQAIVNRLNFLGWTQREISEKLEELFPEAKGVSIHTVNDICYESGNDDFRNKILADISKGLPIPKAAQRYALPEILIWSLKLPDLDDQKKLDALSIKIQRLTGTQSLKNAAVGFTSILTSFTPGIFSVKARRSLANCSATVGPA
jgi:hypothetical protein